MVHERKENEFITTYRALIKRDGADKLLDYLINKSDFFTAPASSKFHCDFEGGLCEHSLNVYRRLLSLLQAEYGEGWKDVYSPETVAVVGLLHDVCKINYYEVDYRNVKNKETGAWEKVPYYKVEDTLPYGHGEKSVFLIERFMKLKPTEAIAIRWHMGFSYGSIEERGTIGRALEMYPLAFALHVADMEASYFLEGSDK